MKMSRADRIAIVDSWYTFWTITDCMGYLIADLFVGSVLIEDVW